MKQRGTLSSDFDFHKQMLDNIFYASHINDKTNDDRQELDYEVGHC